MGTRNEKRFSFLVPISQHLYNYQLGLEKSDLHGPVFHFESAQDLFVRNQLNAVYSHLHPPSKISLILSTVK